MSITWTTKAFSQLNLQELHDVLRLRVDVFVVEQLCAYAEVDGQDPGALHILGRSAQGELIAYARILPPVKDEAPHIGRVVVHAGHRGQGLGREVMEEALRTLETRFGPTPSIVSAQTYLERFYTELGYQRQGPDYDWDGIAHVDMRREANAGND